MSKTSIKIFSFFVLTFASLSFSIPSYAALSKEERQKLDSIIERGQHFYSIKDYPSAIKTWIQGLELDPLNVDLLDKIDDAKFQAEYHEAVLAKLEKEKELKTPYAEELSSMAGEMMDLLKEAEGMIKYKQQEKLTSVTKEDAVRSMNERQEYIQKIFYQGMSAYNSKDYDTAFTEWEKILSVLPNDDKLAIKIRELRAQVNRTEVAKQKKSDKVKASENEVREIANQWITNRPKEEAEPVQSEPVHAQQPVAQSQPQIIVVPIQTVGNATPQVVNAPESTNEKPVILVSETVKQRNSEIVGEEQAVRKSESAKVRKPDAEKGMWGFLVWVLVGLGGLIGVGVLALIISKMFAKKKFVPKEAPKTAMSQKAKGDFNPRQLARYVDDPKKTVIKKIERDLLN